MDIAILKKVIAELEGLLPGARVKKVVPDAGSGLILVLHAGRKDRYLLLSADRGRPRMHLISARPAGPAGSSGFFLQLRKHLVRSRCRGIRLVNDDRVVELEFAGASAKHRLYVELTGTSANIVLAGADRKIIAVLHPVTPGEGAARALVPGLGYAPPEKRHGAGVRRTMAYLDAGTAADLPVNKAVEAWHKRMIAEQELTSRRTSLVSSVRSALRRTERRRAAIAIDVANAEDAERYRSTGDLIIANKHVLKKGMSHAMLAGHEGVLRGVELDPRLTPAGNAERYFRKYKKAKAGVAVMRERLADADDGIAFLRQQETALGDVDDLRALDRVAVELERNGIIRSAGKAIGRVRTAPEAPFRTVVFEGWEILVGKSAAGNDYLTMKLARPDDLWLHAEGMPGSHVVVRNPEKRDMPESVLRRAASLAAWHSKGKGSAKVPVAYTRAALVRKPKGAPPGTVVLTGRKTFMAAPEP